jgi:hypothetical protein
MPVSTARKQLFFMVLLSTALSIVFSTSVFSEPPPDKGKPPGGGKTVTLKTVKSKDWDEAHVRRILRAFAYIGFASDGQIQTWADMKPEQAIVEMLTFDVNNEKLSPSEDANALYCGSLEDLQGFWSSDHPDNVMTWIDRYRYDTLVTNADTGAKSLRDINLQLTWSKAVSTRGCNPFLLKTALYLSNYHASIHTRNTRAGLIRAYYDDFMKALSEGRDFVEVMTMAAKHAAVARAYGHQYNKVINGVPAVNEDFAREYLQLFFGINGTTETEPGYHETVTIKNNALLLTGMDLDREEGAYGSDSGGDWWVSPIIFTDHTDYDGNVRNETYHYDNAAGAGSCLTILREIICGATADVKLEALGPIAGAHEESLDNTPVKFINFFADDNLDADKIEQIRGSWREAEHDILAFLQAYAVSTAFHSETTFKYFTAFDRNIQVQLANTLTNEENFARRYYRTPYYRMRTQGVEIFEPIRNVFGHQTGIDAANDPFLFKDAFKSNASDADFLYETQYFYTFTDPSVLPVELFTWVKEWGSVIPVNGAGEHVVEDVAGWLWNHFIGDDGKNFDPIARAQVQALLAQGRDFAYTVDPANRDPDPPYNSADITGGHLQAFNQDGVNATTLMDLTAADDDDRELANDRVGMAVNFITMTPYAFAMEGQ